MILRQLAASLDGTVATGGLSILAEGLWDRWVGTATNPCDELFEQADEASAMLKKMIGRL